MVVKNIILSTVSVSIYLFTMMGVGRYSCHCDHSSEISLFGIVSKCSCTHHEHKAQKEHHCICGAHLEVKEHKRDDCCKVSFFFLDTDQDSQSHFIDLIVPDNPLLISQNIYCPGITAIQRPVIKTFQALFRKPPTNILELNRQLIL
ncbi:hypothetical protein MASR2M69_18280 [Bacteroidota bacterium]